MAPARRPGPKKETKHHEPNPCVSGGDLLVFCLVQAFLSVFDCFSLGILAHRTSDDDWGVQSLPKRKVFRLHETILRFGEPGPLGFDCLNLD